MAERGPALVRAFALALVLVAPLLVGCLQDGGVPDSAPVPVEDPEEIPWRPAEPKEPAPEPSPTTDVAPQNETETHTETEPDVSEDPAVEAKVHWTQQPFPHDGHPEVRSYFEALEVAATEGTAVVLPTVKISTFLGSDGFGDASSVSLVLQRSAMLDNTTWFEINGIPYEGPFLRIYAGHVEGEPTQIAHVIVAEDFIRGAVRIGDAMEVIRIRVDGNLPVDLAPADPWTPESQDPQSPEPSSCPDDHVPLNNGLRAVPPYLDPVDGLAVTGPAEELLGRVILDADWKAYERWGRHLPAMMASMLVEMDLAYRYEVGIHHHLVGIHLNLIPDYTPDPEDVDPFGVMSEWWDGFHVGERDVIHLFTGWESSYAMANCIGSVGTTAGYSFSSIFWEEEYKVFHENAFAHEFGHLYAAHHHYGNHAESELATIMIQGYTPGAQPQFSALSRSVIRGWAEEYLDPWA